MTAQSPKATAEAILKGAPDRPYKQYLQQQWSVFNAHPKWQAPTGRLRLLLRFMVRTFPYVYTAERTVPSPHIHQNGPTTLPRVPKFKVRAAFDPNIGMKVLVTFPAKEQYFFFNTAEQAIAYVDQVEAELMNPQQHP